MMSGKSLLILVTGVLTGTFLTVLAILYNYSVQQHQMGRVPYTQHLPINKNDSEKDDRGRKYFAPISVDSSTTLYSQVRVLCWVMTSPRTLYTKAVHVRETWGKRCNKILFFSSVEDKDFPAIGLNVQEGRGSLYDKTRQAFQHIWTHYRDQADWFMKTDDDTFVILENLRFLLKDYDHNQPMYFGRKFKRYIEQGYMSGGAGYVLSRAALNRYAMAMSKRRCPKGYNIEDLELGKCLSYIGVRAMDSRDYRKRETFFPFAPEYHLRPGRIPAESWYWKYIYYPNPSGPECCSDFAISFHYIEPDMMYVLEYFVYKLNVFGMHQVQQKKDPSKQLPVSNNSLQTDNVS